MVFRLRLGICNFFTVMVISPSLVNLIELPFFGGGEMCVVLRYFNFIDLFICFFASISACVGDCELITPGSEH